MADLDGCAFCEVQGRNTWMLTHLNPPATVHSCEDHAVINVVTLLATMIDVSGDWLYGLIEVAVNEAVAEAKAEEEQPEKPKRRPRKATQPTPEMDAEITDASV